ncbi:MAG: hypothetical protein K0R76_269 [Alphaproteobacteria bacterium]|jgi:hypothetical protein|nr:hypothetical protein [Alphaproteobacteria bacterium]MDF3033315.1 hypothetical protein [Alphaproteobacteria bacterium]
MATLPMGYTTLLDFYAAPWVIPIVLSAIAGLSFIATLGIDKDTQGIANDPDQKAARYDLAG